MDKAFKDAALKLCELLYGKKAEDILALHVADKTIIADWFVVASGRATVQLRAMADELEEKAGELGLTLLRKEGYTEGRWIVLDFASILVHLFHPEERAFYNMERLWEDEENCLRYPNE